MFLIWFFFLKKDHIRGTETQHKKINNCLTREPEKEREAQIA